MNEQAKETDNIDKASSHDVAEAVEEQALAKIEPVKVAASDVADAEVAETETRGLEIQRGVPIGRDTHFFEVSRRTKVGCGSERGRGDAARHVCAQRRQ
jgi:hypothetical protein